MKELAGVKPGDSEAVALGKVLTPPMLSDTAAGLKNDPTGTLIRLGVKVGMSPGIPTALRDVVADVMADPKRIQNLLGRLDNFITPQPIL